MKFRKFAPVASIVSLRDALRDSAKKPNKKRYLEFFAGELEKRQLLATFGYNSGTGLLTIQTDSANEQLSIISTSGSGNYTITTTGSWSGSETDITASGASLYVNQPSGLASILFNDNGGAITGSGLSFGTSSANFVSNLTANFTSGSSTISVGNATSFTSGKALSLTGSDIALTNSISIGGNLTASAPVATGQISVTGPITATGTAAVSLTGRNISVTGNISTQAGDITLYGNGGGSFQTGSFQGVLINGSAVNVNTTSGSINIDGRGGRAGNFEGVLIQSATVQAGGTGNLNIQGISGNGTGGVVTGTYLNSASLKSVNGLININGTSCSTGSDCFGVMLESSTANSTGNGGIQITGISGTGNVREYGIHLKSSGTAVTTANGPISVTGQSRGSDINSKGMYYTDGGIVGFVAGGSQGTISLTGTTANQSALGLDLDRGNVWTSGGQVTINSNTLNIGSATVNATTAGNVLIQTLGAGVNLGGADSAANLGLTSVEINKITANRLTIGNSTQGNISVTSAVSLPANTSLALVANTASSCISVGSALSATGTGAISLTSRNISVTGNITAEAGDITLYGNGGGSYQAGTFDGVCISGSTVNVNTTSGNITIDGRGASGSVGAGVNLTSSKVQAGGSGCVTITGVSGNGMDNAYGIYVSSATVTTSNGVLSLNGTACGWRDNSRGIAFQYANISTNLGNMTLAGTAANGTNSAVGISVFSSTVTTSLGSIEVNGTSNGTGVESFGVGLYLAVNISVTGGGNLTINGTDLRGTNDSRGIDVYSSNLTTTTGAITLNGISCGTGTNARGVNLRLSANISATGGGNVTIRSPRTPTSGIGINSCSSTGTINSNGGLITLTANSMNLTGTVNATSAGNVLIQTLGAGVDLGGADSSANLGLTSAELNNITANQLTIGNSTTGNITVTAAISRPTNGSLVLDACTTSSCISVGSALSVTGTGAISLTGRNIVVNSCISTGAGDIALLADNGSYQAGSFSGVIFNNGNNLTTSGGNVTVTGRGGAGSGSFGMEGGALMTAGGSGNITLTGYGAAGGGYGMHIYGSTLRTDSGQMTFNGTGIDGASRGVSLNGSFTSNTGNININGTKDSGSDSAISLWAATIATGGNAGINITAVINNATSTGGSALTLEYTDTISTSNGPISISAVSNATGSTYAFKSGAATNNIMANGTGGSITINANLGNITNGSGIGISTNGYMNTTNGPITLLTNGCVTSAAVTRAGNSGSISVTGRNIGVSGGITSGSGNITLNGNGNGSYQSGSFRGVDIAASVCSTSGGSISVSGVAGSSGGEGVYLSQPVIASNGAISITGDANVGKGIAVQGASATIIANGTNGSVTLTAYSGTTGETRGMDFWDNSRVNTSDGPITLVGTSRGASDSGVWVEGNANITAGNAGTVTVTGYNGGQPVTIDGRLASSGGLVSINGDKVFFGNTANVTSTSAGNLSIQPTTANRAISVGGGDSSTQLGVAQAELNRITTGCLTIGSTTAGNISLASSVTWGTNVTLFSALPINGTLSNSNHTFTQGSYTLTATGTIATNTFDPYQVTTTADSGAGSLRSIVTLAASNPGNDVISFSSSLSGSTITLSTPITINDSSGNLTITGLGSGNLTIGGSSSLFTVQSNVTLTGMTFTNTLTSTSNLTLSNVATSYATAVTQTGGSLTINSSNIVNSVVIAGGANYTVVGGTLGSAVSISSGNQVSITGLSQDITLGSINAGGLTVTTNTTSNAISVSGPVGVTGSGAISLTGRNIVVTGNITSQAGDITLYGNGGGSYQTGTFEGVCISGSTVNVNTTSGNITIDGRGGLNTACAGVNLTSSNLQGGGAGCVTITGMSGNGSAISANGILASGATVTTISGRLNINGTSCSTGQYSRGVYLNSSANISATGSGNVTITGTAATGATNNPSGIHINAATITSNTGSLTVNGTSCGTGIGSGGVFLAPSANISATGTGDVTITGTAANGSNSGRGIFVNSAIITTSTGSLTINGTSCATGTNTKGIILYNSSNISATNTSNVTITGSTPGNTSTGIGIHSFHSAAKVYSNGGLITLTANSVELTGTVNATTAGNVMIQTLGAGVNLGGADSSANLGLTSAELNNITANQLTIGNSTTGAIVNTAAISRANLTLISGNSITQTGAGNLSISGTANFVSSGTGTAGNITLSNATNDFGIVTASGTNLTIADTNALTMGSIAGNGTVQITAQNVTITSTVNATVSGSVVLIPKSGTVVDLGTKSTGNFGLTSTEIGNITANLLTIGNSTAGAIVNTAAISRANLTLVSGNSITQTGAGNLTISGTANFVSSGTGTAGNITLNNSTNDFGTVRANGTNITIYDSNNLTIGAVTANGDFAVQGDNTTSCISVTGPVNATGGSGNISLTGRNIVVTGNILTAAGGISLIGNNGTYQSGTFDGVQISGAAVNVNTTGGSILIDGRGGFNTVNAGVNLTSSKVQAGGSGCVTITGVSGNGSTNYAYGIYACGSTVTTSTGSITVNGTSCGTGTSSFGLYQTTSANISATGAGNVTITGIAANGTNSACGIYIYNYSIVTTNNGTLTINGTSNGTGTGARGVDLSYQSNISATGAGNVSITGTAANGTTSAYGIYISQTPVTTSSGAITINGTSCGTGTGSRGVVLAYGTTNISATGAGNVTITGRASGTFDASGILVRSSAKVSTSTGTLTVNGTSCGTQSTSRGVCLDDSANISATGAGNVTITGTAANGTIDAYGIFLQSSPKITSSTGKLTVNGTSCGTGTGARGVYLKITANISATGAGEVTITGSTPGNLSTGVGFLSFDSGSKVYANGGLITLTANSVNMTGTVNATSAGNVLIQTFGSGVNLGNGTDTSANLGLSQSELNKITANQLIIGDRATNATISLTQNMSWSSNLSIRSNLPISGILSNSNHTFTQGSYTLTATGTILLDSPTVNYTVLVSSNSPVTYGTSVLLTASLTHSGSAFNSGTVSFYNNGVLLGSGNITNDLANYTWSGASAGTYGNITATGLVPGGTDNGSNTASVVVNQANLTITANNAAKTYDASAYTGGNGVAYIGFVGGENSTVLSGTLVYGGDSQGAVNAGSYIITPSNLTSANYNITFANGSLTVATAPLTITANGVTKTYGSNLSDQMGLQTSGYISTGLQGSDTLTNVTLTSTGAAPTANIGSYTITPSAANSATLANYNITYANGSLTVNQANLTITSSSNSKQYGLGSPLNNATGFSNGTMYNGDTIASVNLVSSGEALTANVGSYGITASGASLAATGVGNISNYNITYASTGSLSVTQAPMTLTSDNRTKRYGDSLTLGTTCFTLSGTLYNGDTITNATLTAPQAANTSAPIGNYPIAPSTAVAGNTGVGNISNYNINYTNGTLAVWESLSTTVTSSSDVSNPFDDQVTLREAIDYGTQLTGNRTISFAQSIFSSNATTITLTQGVLAVNDNSGTLNIQGPLVSSANRLTVSGGNSTGIFSLATTTIISNMTLSGGNASTGAAIFNNASTSLTGLTIQDNAASANGAGIYNDIGGQLAATFTTFANNTAVGDGGAVYNNGGTVSLNQSSIAFNAATTGGGIKNYGGTANLLNTIVANNTGYFVNPDVAGNINANYSLIGNSAGAVTTGSNNLQDVTALIGSLNYYGGTTKVYPLLPGSPAINAGFGSNVTDQRGITVAGTADIGSFQSRGFNITRTGGNCQTAMIGDAFPANLSLAVASSYSEPVNGGVITFTAPVGNMPSATMAGSTTISSGNVSLQATANAYYGSTSNQNYNITANAAGAVAGTSYQLLNVGTPSTVNITSGNNQSGSLTGNFAQTLGINVKDSVGNNIPRLAVTFTPNTSSYGATGNIAGQGNGLTYTGTTDSNGNITGLTYASNGIGGMVTVVANATVTQIPGVRPQATSTANFYEGAVGMTIQNGTAGRSFVNSAAIMVGNATLASYLLTSGRAVLQFLGYSGTSNATAPSGTANISASSGSLIWNYGSNGITGDPNSQNGDGVYQLAVDYNGDGRWTYVKFHRLFGDVNGDRVVDTTDYNVVINPTVYAKTNITSGANTNGQGQVYTKDVTTVLRQRGRRVVYNAY